MNKPKIVVCGATGNQGGAVVRSLIETGSWHVIALTRDPDSQAAQKLIRLGAEVIRADTTDQSSLRNAFENVYGVFGVTQPWNKQQGTYNTIGEMLQAKNILWAAKEAGAEHIVFSTFLNYENAETGVGFVDSKLLIERLIRQQRCPFTIIRPGLYMDHLPHEPDRWGRIRYNYCNTSGMPYVALDDIGRSVAEIFSRLACFGGKVVDLVGDLRSGEEIASVLTTRYQRDVIYMPFLRLPMRLFKPQVYRLRLYLEKYGRPPYSGVVQRTVSNTRKHFPDLMTVTSFLINKEESNT